MAEEGYKWTGWEERGAVRRKYGGFEDHMRFGDKVVLTVNWCLTFAWSLTVLANNKGVCKVQNYISAEQCSLPNASVTSLAPIPDVYCGRAIVINGERGFLAHIH